MSDSASAVDRPHLRVLAVLHHPVFAGPHNHMLRLGPALPAAGADLTVVVPPPADFDDPSGLAEPRLRQAGLSVIELPLSRVRRGVRENAEMARRLAGNVRELRRLMHRLGIDVVLLHGLAHPHGAIAGRLSGAAVVWQVVDTGIPPPLPRPLTRLAEGASDTMMFWGENVRRLHVGERRCHVPSFLASPPVDLERFAYSPGRGTEARKAAGIPLDVPLVGMIASINPQKGIEYFVDAAAEVRRQVPDTWFVLAGPRLASQVEYFDAIHRKIRGSSHLDESFVILGPQSAPENLFAALDLALLTSVPCSEGIPTTALEAMASEVPVVTTDVGSASEAVVDGETGVVVPPLDATQIAHAVVGLLRDPPRRQRMGKAGRARAERLYGIDAAVDLHMQAFTTAVAHRDQRWRTRRFLPRWRASYSSQRFPE